MAAMNDYHETRTALVKVTEGLDRARLAAGRTNLPPSMAPNEIRAQIDHIDQMIADVAAELDSAREACSRAGRRGLSVCN